MAESNASQQCQLWLDRFFASYYRHRPVNATFIGEHAHDHALPDYSPKGVEAALADAEALLRDSANIPNAGLTQIERMDKRLAEGYLRIQQWEFGSTHFHRGNPSVYTGEAIFSVIGLFLTDFGPAQVRVAAAVERMRLIPRLLGQGETNLRAAPVAWTERALRECTGARHFFGKGVDLLPEATGANRQALRRAADVALEAFARFEAFLRDRLIKADSDAVASGGEAFDMFMREGHRLEMNGDAIAEYAAERLAVTQAELAEQAAAFGVKTWQNALAQLSDLHPTVSKYLGHYQALWDKSRALAEAKQLVTWPDFPIEYVPRPAWSREAAPWLYFLFYRAPAAYNRPAVHRYLVTPIDKSMPREMQKQLLRANNDSVIKLNHVVHHGGIGHHVQNWNAYQSPSRIGRVAAVDTAARIAMFSGGTMAEGWACYATTLMGEAGFLTPLEGFSELQTDLRMAARAIVDVKLHQGRLTLDEAATFYAENTGMSSDASMGEAVKNSMFPGAAVIYLMGRDQILRLRAAQQGQLGARFDLRRFHDRFLSFGSVPVSCVATIMRDEAQQEEVSHAQ